jgi:hypothetical protein
MQFGDLLALQIRELAKSSRAVLDQLHDKVINDVGAMPLVCSTRFGTPPVYSSSVPPPIYTVEIPAPDTKKLFDYYGNKAWVECKDSTTDTCEINAERSFSMKTLSMAGYSVIGRAFAWETQTNPVTNKSFWYLPPTSHIAKLTFYWYDSDCKPLSSDLVQNGYKFKAGDCQPASSSTNPFAVTYPTDIGTQLTYTHYIEKNMPAIPAWALEVKFVISSVKQLFGKSILRAPHKPNTTGAVTYATATSRPFCGLPVAEDIFP